MIVTSPSPSSSVSIRCPLLSVRKTTDPLLVDDAPLGVPGLTDDAHRVDAGSHLIKR
jgi:hypothetical protein